MSLDVVVGAPELCEQVWRELSLEGDVVLFGEGILEVEVLSAVAEVVVAAVEIIRNCGSIGENIRILTLAIGIIAILML